MPADKKVVQIPVVRDGQTFDQRRDAMLTNLEKDFDRPEYDVAKTNGSKTTAQNVNSNAVTAHDRSSLHDDWGREVKRWVNESRRDLNNVLARMRNDMFMLEPIDRFGRDDWGLFRTLSDPFSLLATMEREMDAIRQQIPTLCPFDTSNIGAAYEVGDDGQLRYKLRFNTKDFAPEDIDVKTVGNQLVVFAKHETPTSKKEFCRTIELPRSLDQEHFKCHLTKDGVLMLEAPVKSPDYKSITLKPDQQLGIRPKSEAEVKSSTKHGKAVALKPTGVSGPTILHEGETGRKLHLEVPVEPEYDSDNLTVTMDGKRIIVSGRKSESHSTGTHTSCSSKEFSKSYEIPGSIDPLTVTAQITNGVLMVEAPLNSE